MERHDWFGWERVEAPRATRDQLSRVHALEHVDLIAELSARGGGAIDMDTTAVAGTYEAALRGAGGAVALVDALLRDGDPCGVSALRPPGHHAEQGPRDGLLLLQQHRRRGGARDRRARRRARPDPRLGRPSRQRDERHLPRRSVRAVLLDPRMAAVSRHGPGGRRRLGPGGGVHGQPAGPRRVGRRGARLARGARRGPADPCLGAAARAHLRRLRRASRRPAGDAAADRGRLRRDDRLAAPRMRGRVRAARARARGRLRGRCARRLDGRRRAGARCAGGPGRRRAVRAPARGSRPGTGSRGGGPSPPLSWVRCGGCRRPWRRCCRARRSPRTGCRSGPRRRPRSRP